jgi:hypothetical protein
MSKHTEGPWSTNHVGFTHAKNGACIAEVGIDVLPFEEVEANGKLIAAAPDLLEALQNLENDNGQIPDHAWKLVQDAIAKATTIQ